MTRDNKPVLEDDDDDFGGESHAADEPTAVWDEQSLRAAGLSELLARRPSEPPPPPATPATAPSDPSIVVDRQLSGEHARASGRASMAAESSFGWPATFSIAIVLGAIVYVLVRLAKG